MKLTRRTLLKSSAASALMMLTGCGGDSSDPLGLPGNLPGTGPITRVAVHPAIGIARVGNSPDEFFVAPELPGTQPDPGSSFKDAAGFLKRQAVRFRLFGYDAQGRVVREITADDAAIEWTVELANHKAEWYDFEMAMDIPEAVSVEKRNSGVTDRASLRVEPGSRTVSAESPTASFDDGQFQNQTVYLGELQMEPDGQLLVLGGRGRSISPSATQLVTFGNNDGWVDDISDGPVRATVKLGEQVFEADPAWAVVAPPNYGPGLETDFRTLYDVIGQVMLDLGFVSRREVSFNADILPLFTRMAGLEWVNQGVFERYGWGSPEPLADPDFLARLNDPSPQNEAFRREWFARFRDPLFADFQLDLTTIPPIYGDAVAIPPDSARDYIAVTQFQYNALSRWAAGDFLSDFDPGLGALLETVEQVPLQLLPAALDRGALEPCLGDAFHPGCEATWPVRVSHMWSGPYRLKLRTGPEPDFGDVLTPGVAVAADGPLNGNQPGSVTRWMAVPWQTDTVSCRSGYDQTLDPFLPTFWAARVPNHVLSEEDYQTVMNQALPLADRQAAFANRQQFFRGLGPLHQVQILQDMVDRWFKLGLVASRPGPDDPAFPPVMKVETERDLP
ncbi:MAG: LodA/GoxA family CTQ-dependent oxidase [Candidatus Eremiobacteraeota bacterium]|nr:LodA/GoxA family CTQ-dependent oxidase [Candidatus Eremiobacteraeota bacterium]